MTVLQSLKSQLDKLVSMIRPGTRDIAESDDKKAAARTNTDLSRQMRNQNFSAEIYRARTNNTDCDRAQN